MNFIADFVCLSLKLVIEVDGITHHDEKAIIKDLNRQRLLEQEGFCILRFSDNEVLNRIEGVAKEIEDWIERFEIANGISGPPPSPPPAGNGATA
jgi:very-short-patch-repair endonuclease